MFYVLSVLFLFVGCHKYLVDILEWRGADSCDVDGRIPGDGTAVPFLFLVQDTMVCICVAPYAVRLWVIVVFLMRPFLWGQQA